jgi:ribosomal protein S18 acetylase RimI-like enzyme
METAFTFSFLRERDVPELYETFLAAFADYIVPIKITREEFAMKFKREGVEPTFCAGAYQEQQLVGFIMTGLGEWQGKPTAYNAGTGVLPAHRGHGLTRQLYQFMLPKLRESGIEQCLLEVIQENDAAFKVYQSIGFQVTRSLDCYRSLKQHLLLSAEEPKHITLRKASKPNWEAYAEFCDTNPAWQNTKQAFRKSPDQKLILEAYLENQLLVGYVAFFPRTGAIAQLAAHDSYRNRGVATTLLKEVVNLTEAPALMMMNIDSTCAVLSEFMERSHFTRILRQYEMLLPLT